jgi:2-phosphosulfolactate phosphatase
VSLQPVTLELAWGTAGARTLALECDVIVVVDVLSFTTAVTVATSYGAGVRPVTWDEQLPALAPGDVLAGPRDGPGPTLSPSSLRQLQPGQRLLLPSPNGAEIAVSLNGMPTVAASLRNAGAVAEWLREHGGHIGIVAAGERDAVGGWRPSYEDVLGAGAIAARFDGGSSPQVAATAAAFRETERELADRLLRCRSGCELAERGFAADVEDAAQLDADRVVPTLRDGTFLA